MGVFPEAPAPPESPLFDPHPLLPNSRGGGSIDGGMPALFRDVRIREAR